MMSDFQERMEEISSDFCGRSGANIMLILGTIPNTCSSFKVHLAFISLRKPLMTSQVQVRQTFLVLLQQLYFLS